MVSMHFSLSKVIELTPLIHGMGKGQIGLSEPAKDKLVLPLQVLEFLVAIGLLI